MVGLGCGGTSPTDVPPTTEPSPTPPRTLSASPTPTPNPTDTLVATPTALLDRSPTATMIPTGRSDTDGNRQPDRAAHENQDSASNCDTSLGSHRHCCPTDGAPSHRAGADAYGHHSTDPDPGTYSHPPVRRKDRLHLFRRTAIQGRARRVRPNHQPRSRTPGASGLGPPRQEPGDPEIHLLNPCAQLRRDHPGLHQGRASGGLRKLGKFQLR